MDAFESEAQEMLPNGAFQNGNINAMVECAGIMEEVSVD